MIYTKSIIHNLKIYTVKIDFKRASLEIKEISKIYKDNYTENIKELQKTHLNVLKFLF